MSDLMCFDCGHKFEGIDIDDLNCCLNCGSNNYDSIDSLEMSYAERGFKAGQQSKQAEIDELQKRIDEALKTSKEFYDFGDGESAMAFCNEIINILKGNTNDH